MVFDLETTGTRPGVSRIVEIGAVRLQGFEQVGLHEQLVDPGIPVPSTITGITGIESRDLRGAPRIARALPAFLEFAEGAVLVAHNARFDVGFVDAELSRLESRRLAAPVIDTVALARRLLEGRLPRMNLGTLAERFDTEVRPCHRALPDAQATAEVLVQPAGHGAGARRPHGGRCGRLRRPRSVGGCGCGASSLAACPAGPASTCSATATTACCTSARPPTCERACAPTSPAASCGGGSSTRWRRPSGSRRGRWAASWRRRWSSWS